MHMSTSHDVVGTIMASDGRIGMESVLAKLFPGVEYQTKKMMVNVKEERIPDIKSSTPLRRKRGPASRVKVEPSQAHTPITSREEEDVDDPSSVSPHPISSSHPRLSQSWRTLPHRIDRAQLSGVRGPG